MSLKSGFSLVEILVLLVVTLSMVTVLLSSSGTLKKTRSTNLSGIAVKIASCEIERLRGVPFSDSVFSTDLGTPQAIPAPCNADLSKLAASTATRTIINWGIPANPDIKQITIDISWTESGAPDNVQIATLKSKYGI